MRSQGILRLVSTSLLLAAGAAVPAAAATVTTSTPSPEVRARHEVRVVPPGSGRAMVLERGKRGYLGVSFLDLTPELRRHFQVDEKAGLLVSHVDGNSPAARAGIEVGDVVTAIDGKPVDDLWDVRQLVSPRKAGDTVSIDLVRDGRRDQVRATLEEREGHVIELGRLWKSEGDDDDATMLVMPSPEQWKRFGEEMGQMGEEIGASVSRAMADPQVRMKIRERVGDREELQRRIDELERRLRELERKLRDQQRR